MDLSNLKPALGSKRAAQRVGRGNASRKGGTCGRGTKGQKSRSGGSIAPWFEGGQMPIYRRLPKRGFKNMAQKEYTIINIQDLLSFEAGDVVDMAVLKEKGKIKQAKAEVKLLSKGAISFPLVIKLHKASKAAIEKIEKVGGRFEFIEEEI
ncbi:MAG: 50S ribosomal protein L15 [Deltaproteobacteria bacterium]|nr:50S ribosomal protein L15 [Deltaproteobacteria bacterium]